MTETLVVAALCVGLALVVRPGAGIAILLASALLWPEYLRVPLGVVQMSVPRFVALALIVRHLGRIGILRRTPVDFFVVLGYILSVVAVVAADANPRLVTSTIGRGLDTVVMYFAARLCLATFDDIKDMRWPLVLTALSVGAMAGLEAWTKRFLYGWAYFGAGNPEVEIGEGRGGVGQARWGMMRAQLATAHPIYFGVAMTIVVGYILMLRQSLSTVVWWAALAGAAAGVFFCLSSGPWTAAFLLVLLLPFYKATWLIKPAIGATILLCILLELVTNRHFYHLICYIGLSNATAWYRVRLLEVAFKYLPEYWLFGYGGRSFEHWGLEIDGRFFIDCVNNYVLIAAMSGVPTMLCYLGAKIAAVWCIAKAWRRYDPSQRWIVFTIVATLLAVALAECSVSVFGPSLLFNGILLGTAASAAAWARTAPQPATQAAGRSARRPIMVRTGGRDGLRRPDDGRVAGLRAPRVMGRLRIAEDDDLGREGRAGDGADRKGFERGLEGSV
jgi:hypothetical protein